MALEYKRLSDRILFAFELPKGDLKIAEYLMQAMETAMTRAAGGKDFVERRELAPEYEAAIKQYEDLKVAMRIKPLIFNKPSRKRQNVHPALLIWTPHHPRNHIICFA